MRQYPIGIQDFASIINGGFVYVDKTEPVYQLACVKGVYFLSRPRRFGKSLLVSTLKYYFQGRKDLFKGLKMEQLEKDWKEYPVFEIDFNGKKFVDYGTLHLQKNTKKKKKKKNNKKNTPGDPPTTQQKKKQKKTNKPSQYHIYQKNKPNHYIKNPTKTQKKKKQTPTQTHKKNKKQPTSPFTPQKQPSPPPPPHPPPKEKNPPPKPSPGHTKTKKNLF